MEHLNFFQTVAVWALPVVFAITVHEAAHGWAAKYFGDRTAELLGRITLNPVKHIDPMGTVLVPLVLLWMGGWIIGWAKPVPVAQRNLRRPKQDMAWVALAGPMSNLVMALIWGFVVKLGGALQGTFDWMAVPMVYMGTAGIYINVILLVVNLLPIPPLDGGRVLSGFLPEPFASYYNRIEPFGLFILIGLLLSGALGYLLQPAFNVVYSTISAVLSL